MSNRRESKFYQTSEFKRLYEKWVTGKNSKLKKTGFEDVENPNGSLKIKNKRTQAFRQQETVARISSALCAYIENDHIQLSKVERQILELHSQGVYRKDIIKITKKCRMTIWRIQKKHIPLALGLYAEEDMGHFDPSL